MRLNLQKILAILIILVIFDVVKYSAHSLFLLNNINDNINISFDHNISSSTKFNQYICSTICICRGLSIDCSLRSLYDIPKEIPIYALKV